MAITIQEIEHLAKLSKLALSGEEKQRLTGEMQNILEFADKLAGLKTDADPTLFTAEGHNVFREDVVCPSLPTVGILQNAPEADMECFVVPKTVE